MNNKKIGTFLMIMLVITAVLILLATPKSKLPESDPTTEPAQTTVPVTQSVDEQAPEEPAQTDVPVSAEPESGMREQVKRVLDENGLERTALTHRSAMDSAEIGGAAGRAQRSGVHALAQIAGERKMNPIAAFWMLVSEEMYEKREDQSDGMDAAAFDAPVQEAKNYAYTDEGTRQMLTDLLALAAQIPDEQALETALLGEDGVLEPEQISESGKDACRYAYFSCSSEYATHILCFYLRDQSGDGWIDDVEFQLLSMRHADGEDDALEMLDGSCARQAVSLMAAAELLMTGSTRTGEGKIPFGYTVGTYQAGIGRYDFTAEDQQGSLTNYRLRAK